MSHSHPCAPHKVITILLALSLTAIAAPSAAQMLLDPVTHPKFVNPLPIPSRLDVTAGGRYDMEMREVQQLLGLVGPDGAPLVTTVWGYGQTEDDEDDEDDAGVPVTYPGPTFIAYRDVPLDIKWKNKLPRYEEEEDTDDDRREHDKRRSDRRRHLLPVDWTLHIAHPAKGGIPTVTHLHGGHTESASDGLPEAWFTQGFKERGPHFVKKTYHYDNDQEAATLWYHDHALGITRLNVYAGLAGFYLLRDDNEMQLTSNGVLPSGPYEVEIVIQDRMFTEDGQLFFPATGAEVEPGFDPLPAGPSVIAEFFGDFILVNGAPWPRLDVEPRKYRLRLLNGSDSRFYVLELHEDEMAGTAQEFYQIGTDDGFLVTPVPLSRLLLAPGERADVIVDFSGQTELTMRNFGPDEPFKGFNPDGTISDGAGGVAPPADPATTGKIMKFAVSLPLDPGVANATVGMGTVLRPDILPLQQDGSTRSLVLFEGLDNYGRLQPLLGTLDQGSMAWFEPITENPMVNDVEAWEVYNATEDAHPIHLHLVSFQIQNRESFVGFVQERPQLQHDGAFGVGGELVVTALGGDPRPAEPNEQGWKDTAVMLPGEVTRVIARFDRPGRYVWHCHILSHEDHEMMRPFQVGPMPMPDGNDAAALASSSPNPFNPRTQISFSLPEDGPVELMVYDIRGQRIRVLAEGVYPAGEHAVIWDGTDESGRLVASGVYIYRLEANGISQSNKMTLIR